LNHYRCDLFAILVNDVEFVAENVPDAAEYTVLVRKNAVDPSALEHRLRAHKIVVPGPVASLETIGKNGDIKTTITELRVVFFCDVRIPDRNLDVWVEFLQFLLAKLGSRLCGARLHVLLVDEELTCEVLACRWSRR